ncbi:MULTISPECIES: dTDP-4-dehydrorhamnose reductase [unclassified Arsukibacterium]|uniref:dTDP-4-dehydrorhamnose reductase n=1 Tax=unclassified Arsukibacterium TaxID=2635278 RepID=UPI000C934C9B|nr:MULTISPECIES: dTDP-4-dehydrorhamnose reductase [unclassified Arsukibacterium]MAA95094.1 dTDP-4-dehydrorhamnose reductase [Rheinheimera sp.]HAW94468.1 dTDP-4-dehydrorhamnose reductase [Candidatus Azambacteria bacterium]|tara:strand:- start:211 stop:1101 length:891 start_codon:yes stop_codon:yes gene_type:complete
MTDRILVLGASGQLGQAFQAVVTLLPQPVRQLFYFIPRHKLDVTDSAALNRCLKQYAPTIIINTCAFTAVDKAEQQIALAWQLNEKLVAELSDFARASGAALLQFSTDYVFNGQQTKPYTETDMPAPLNQYGKSKLAGEQAMLDIAPAGLILRTSWLYSEFGHNFVRSIVNQIAQGKPLQVVNDQIGSPTYACHLAALCIELVTAANFAERFAKTRLLHCAGQGQASWYQLAQEIVSLTGSDIAVAAVSSNQWPALAKRPVYSGLSSEKLTQQLGLSMPPWQHSLAICLQKMGQSE